MNKGEFSDLEPGQSVDVYGQPGLGGCFDGDEVVVDLAIQPYGPVFIVLSARLPG